MEEAGNSDASPVSPLAKWRNDFARVFQCYLDRSAPHIVNRWLGTLFVAAIYVLRVYYVQGFYVISYGLGIYILNLLIGFMSPKVDPELEVLDGASLPTKDSDEFRPFVRRLPEFKFWYAATKAFCVAFLMTFFSIFDVPVFWPILFFYWVFLFFLTMKRQITHMIKYRYVPFNYGKQILQKDPTDAMKMTTDWTPLEICIGSSEKKICSDLEPITLYGLHEQTMLVFCSKCHQFSAYELKRKQEIGWIARGNPF